MNVGVVDGALADVTVVDYGVGNIGALLNMFDHLGVEAEAVDNALGILSAKRLVLPGIGSFDKAMRTLHDRTLVDPLNEAVMQRRVPVLGVCLGMQLLARGSEEGHLPGLGWIPADVRRIAIPPGSGLKVPHIGWADIVPGASRGLFDSHSSDDEPERFYFDHSFYVVCDESSDVAATIDYGYKICCAVQRGHVSGVQFHPEKSHRFGMRFLSAWVRANAESER